MKILKCKFIKNFVSLPEESEVLLLKNNDVYDYVFQYSVKVLTEHSSNTLSLWRDIVVKINSRDS